MCVCVFVCVRESLGECRREKGLEIAFTCIFLLFLTFCPLSCLFFIHFLFNSYSNIYICLGNAAFFAAYTQTKIYITRKDKENRIKRGRRVELDSLSRGNIEESLAVNARDRGSERGSDGNRIEGVSVGENRGQSVEFLSSVTHCARINSNSGSGSGSVSDSNSVSTGTSSNNNKNNNNNKAVLAAGAMAGLAYVLSSHPLEIASILMQIDVPTKQLLGIGVGQKSVLQYR